MGLKLLIRQPHKNDLDTKKKDHKPKTVDEKHRKNLKT